MNEKILKIKEIRAEMKQMDASYRKGCLTLMEYLGKLLDLDTALDKAIDAALSE